ncbi:TPA: RNA-directed DNA polymerase, partial [Vibrio cholerae]|nr:RNA-directed DNA polymerase [Vibrio cholerae]
MDKLKQQSIEWAITHIRRYGDTDIFPVPFEYESIKHSWTTLKNEIANIDIASYEGRPFQRMLIPKQSGGYRVAIQLDPIDTIVYTALAYEAAELVEQSRTPREKKIACSYRVELGSKGELFQKNNGWDDFHGKSQELAQSGRFKLVVTADIADFYNQVGHHRIRNALELSGVDKTRAKNIENLLMNFTRGQSRGIPIGPSASVIFSETCLSDVDNFLLRKGYTHTRYVDDFRIFCESLEQAHRALHDLTEYLYTAHRLALQTHKTRIY